MSLSALTLANEEVSDGINNFDSNGVPHGNQIPSLKYSSEEVGLETRKVDINGEQSHCLRSIKTKSLRP